MFDSALLRAQEIQAEHPQRMMQLEEALEKEKKELQSNEAQLEKIKKERIGKEQDLAIEEEKVNKAKERLTAVKTNKEYQAALKEVDAIKNRNSRLEEEILVCMEQYDSLKRHLEEIEEHLKITIKKTEEKKKELEKKLEECKKEIGDQQKLRGELLSQIESELLDQYQKIKQKRAGPIVVSVKDSCCQGCHLNIPPQLFNEVKKCKSIIKCPHCNRILYWRKNHETASPATQL